MSKRVGAGACWFLQRFGPMGGLGHCTVDGFPEADQIACFAYLVFARSPSARSTQKRLLLKTGTRPKSSRVHKFCRLGARRAHPEIAKLLVWSRLGTKCVRFRDHYTDCSPSAGKTAKLFISDPKGAWKNRRLSRPVQARWRRCLFPI